MPAPGSRPDSPGVSRNTARGSERERYEQVERVLAAEHAADGDDDAVQERLEARGRRTDDAGPG